MTRSCWNHSTKFEEKSRQLDTRKWSRKYPNLHARENLGGQNTWFSAESLHPVLGSCFEVNCENVRFHQHYCCMVQILGVKSASVAWYTIIMSQVQSFNATFTEPLSWSITRPLSKLSKIHFIAVGQSVSEIASVDSTFMYSQHPARTTPNSERPNTGCKGLNPYDARPGWDENVVAFFSPHKSSWGDLTSRSC